MRKIVSLLFILLFLLSCGGEDLKKVAFVSGKHINQTEIYVADFDGLEEAQLTSNEWADTSPCWSHDNNQIAFVSQRDGSQELYIMASDGTNPRRITFFNKRFDLDVSQLYVGPDCWSKDGQTIVFSFEDTIYKVDFNSTNLLPYPHAGEAPGYSPDGKHISFTSAVDTSYYVRVMGIEGTLEEQILSPTENLPHCSSWSPDSKKLVCTHASDLFLVDITAGDITMLDIQSASKGAIVFGADWGPEGQKILYSLREEGLEGSLQYLIEVKNETSSLFSPKLFTGQGTWSNK